MFNNEVFISECPSVYWFSTSTVSSCYIATLCHKISDHSMKHAIFKMKLFTVSHSSFFSSTQGSEILSCLWSFVSVELYDDPSSMLRTNLYVKENLGIALHLLILFLLLYLYFQFIRESHLFFWRLSFLFILAFFTKFLALKLVRSCVFFEVLLFWPRFSFHSGLSTIIFNIFRSIFNFLYFAYLVIKEISWFFLLLFLVIIFTLIHLLFSL